MKKRIFLTAVIALPIVLGLRSFFREPAINFMFESPKTGAKPPTVGTKPFTVKFSGVGKGLKNIHITYAGEDKTLLLERRSYPEGVKEDTVAVSLSPIAGIEDGPAEIKAASESYGGLKQLKFGESAASKTAKILADLSPPKITLIAGTENISQAGSGVVVYEISGDAVESGVRIGDSFFKGYKASEAGLAERNVRIAFFSYPYGLPEGETVLITAADETGNRRNLPVNYTLSKKNFPEINIEVTERFIKMKMLPMINASADLSPKDIFLLVNGKIRSANNKKIEKVLLRTANKIMWEGRFLRPVGSLKSGFEKRNYVFEGSPIDEQDHLGYDLASLKKNPVRAANNGVVTFADYLGIYGNTVIIDHGMGIATLYGHMSSMSVREGDIVAKGDRIGSTGTTGLAFGDHLHFGIYVGGKPVVPVEWWDDFWVRTRITSNMEEAKAETE